MVASPRINITVETPKIYLLTNKIMATNIMRKIRKRLWLSRKTSISHLQMIAEGQLSYKQVL